MPQRQSTVMQQAALQALPKPPKPPEKPLLPYMRYSRRVWDSVKASHPDAKLWEIGKLIGQMWRELDEETRQEVLNEYDTEKMQYIEQMKVYRSSPAYQHFLMEKSRVMASLQNTPTEESEPEQPARNANTSEAKTSKTWYSIEHIEDNNDEEDPWSIRQMALDRYERNNRLIDEIFSDTRVNELLEDGEENRTDAPSVEVLQIEQANFEKDIENSKAEFERKVAQLQEKTGRFQTALQKYLDFKISAEDEQRMFEKEFLFLQKKWEEHRLKQAKTVQQQQDKPGYSAVSQVPITTGKLLMMPEQKPAAPPTMIETAVRQPPMGGGGDPQFARHPWRPNFAYQPRGAYQAMNPSFHTPMSYRTHEMRPSSEPILTTAAAQGYYQPRTFAPVAGQVEQCWRRPENPEGSLQACFSPGPSMHAQMRFAPSAGPQQQFYATPEQTPVSSQMHMIVDPASYHLQQPAPHQSNEPAEQK